MTADLLVVRPDERNRTRHCPRSIALVPVVDMNVRLPFNLIWKKDDASPVLQTFVAQAEA